ncbi:MAG: site-specific DNA-methyltransferase [Bacteroidetes bacterium]|nr:site-specific DNA-methyltransferase [Bacteroidota bacterium]
MEFQKFDKIPRLNRDMVITEKIDGCFDYNSRILTNSGYECIGKIVNQKLKRKVLAPYVDSNNNPKDWSKTENGNFRLTHPSNIWTDLTVPFWSMPENTDHPTQKPEKLIAKFILASCPENGVVFDPFLGSGTTSVAAKKLGRHYFGIEMNEEYAVWAEKRLLNVEENDSIQGYVDGVFWERNTLNLQKRSTKKTNNKKTIQEMNTLFG